MIGIVELRRADAATRTRLGNRAPGDGPDAARIVAPVLDRIRRDGDVAIAAFMRDVDGVALEPARFRVEAGVAERALERIPPELLAAFQHTLRNLERFHRAQRPAGFELELEPGVVVGDRVHAVGAAGLYVPFGKAVYPSSALMLTVPARVAGVERIVLASGVDPATGEIPDAVLAASALGGATELWRLSGTAAVAAFAFGTATLVRVDVIAGPGGPFVEAAKRLVRGHVGVDLDAGPSETLVLGLDDADPDLLAADLIAEAEHGADSSGLVVVAAAGLARAVADRVAARLAALPEERRELIAAQGREGRSAIVVAPDRAAAIAFAEEVAPEHVVVHAAAPDEVASLLHHAGTICVGSFTPSPVGSYVAGTNHVLPTGGAARYASGLGVGHFMRRQSYERLTREGLRQLRADVAAYARAEGLPGHLAAVDARLDAP